MKACIPDVALYTSAKNTLTPGGYVGPCFLKEEIWCLEKIFCKLDVLLCQYQSINNGIIIYMASGTQNLYSFLKD